MDKQYLSDLRKRHSKALGQITELETENADLKAQLKTLRAFRGDKTTELVSYIERLVHGIRYAKLESWGEREKIVRLLNESPDTSEYKNKVAVEAMRLMLEDESIQYSDCNNNHPFMYVEHIENYIDNLNKETGQ